MIMWMAHAGWAAQHRQCAGLHCVECCHDLVDALAFVLLQAVRVDLRQAEDVVAVHVRTVRRDARIHRAQQVRLAFITSRDTRVVVRGVVPAPSTDAAAGAAEAARAAAARAAEAACRKECAVSCKKDAPCAQRCVDEACR